MLEIDQRRALHIAREFEVGDRIRILDDIGTWGAQGCEATVIETRNDRHLPYVVRVDAKRKFPVAQKWIERA